MRLYRIKRIEEINVLFQIRRNYQRQLNQIRKHPQRDTQACDLVAQIDNIDQSLLASVPATFHKQVTKITQA